jgi:hypothetical protein
MQQKEFSQAQHNLFNSLPKFRNNLHVPRVRQNLTLEDGTDRFSHNVGSKRPSTLRNIREERKSNLNSGKTWNLGMHFFYFVKEA